MLNKIANTIHKLAVFFTWIGTLAGAFMIIVVVMNVGGRFFFKQPLRGTIELVELMTVVLIYSVLPYAEFRRRSIHVDVIFSRFPRQVQMVLAVTMGLIGTAFFITMSWKAGELMISNLFPSIVLTDTLSIPFAPFILVIAIGSLLLGLEMLINAFHPLSKE